MTPTEMQKRMGIGINLGNTLDAPAEGKWAPKAQALFFDQYKLKNFTNVRIPVQWGSLFYFVILVDYCLPAVFKSR